MGSNIIEIQGMICSHCQMSVEKALKAVKGVESVQVDFRKKEAVVTGSAEHKELVKAIEEAGYFVADFRRPSGRCC